MALAGAASGPGSVGAASSVAGGCPGSARPQLRKAAGTAIGMIHRATPRVIPRTVALSRVDGRALVLPDRFVTAKNSDWRLPPYRLAAEKSAPRFRRSRQSMQTPERGTSPERLDSQPAVSA